MIFLRLALCQYVYLFSGFLIASFMLLYSFNISFTKTNLSLTISEPIKVLKVKTFMVFSLVFANNTTSWCFFIFLLKIDFYFLIPAQTFNPTAELEVPIKIPTTVAKAEIETQPMIAETNTRFNVM